jgi:hypothetical protein
VVLKQERHDKDVKLQLRQLDPQVLEMGSEAVEDVIFWVRFVWEYRIFSEKAIWTLLSVK